ncbi:MAG: VCBS repeat-containing protein, partial [Thermoplasmata archaeon]|nr:VCBS repeat-containing protein [Thermoplasmata archaeon]
CGSNGRVDELRFETVVRDGSWLRTCYNNQNNPSGFYSLGNEELAPLVNRAPVLSGEMPSDGSTNVDVMQASVSVNIQDPEGQSFNWFITTSPNIGSNSGVGSSNGTKSCTISGLAYSTVYTWTVKAYDGNRWTNKTYTFTTQAAPVNNPPIVINPNPINMSTGIPISLSSLSVTIQDPEGQPFDWMITTSPNIGSNSGTGSYNGTKSCTISGLAYSTVYTWTVKAYDGNRWTNKTYRFTTLSIIPTLKWSTTSISGVSAVGPLVADVNNDGQMEIIRSGENGIVVYSGTGAVVWWRPMDMHYHSPFEIIDLNKDGSLEIICAYETGTMALHGNDGSVYWYNPNAPLYDKHPVAGDIDADGYPEVFVAIGGAGDGSTPGKITALTHDGQIFATTNQVYFPCWGGLSLGDTNSDGVFELYMNERGSNYYSGAGGVRAYWASNLTERWRMYYPAAITASSHCPTLVDVNNDGILEIVSLQQSYSGGSIYIFNSSDGKVLRIISDSYMGTHSQPTVYDIDGDEHLELMTTREGPRVGVWDLYTGQLKTYLKIGDTYIPGWEPPAIADLDGDGFVEILATTDQNISIFNHQYQFIGSIPLSNPGYYGMDIIVAQDIDNDGLLELVLNRRTQIYTYDTMGAAPTPRALSQFMYYGQSRGRVPYYQEYGPAAPIVKDEFPMHESGNQMLNPTLSVYAFDYQNNLMNITFRTNASTGIWHTIHNEFNVHEGTYTADTTEMTAFGTTYWWNVTATDSTGKTTSKVYTFTTAPESPWWNPEWNYRKKISIDHSKVCEDLMNFPVLIRLDSDADIKNHAQANGNDIVFTDVNGNMLHHEIELYESATGRL